MTDTTPPGSDNTGQQDPVTDTAAPSVTERALEAVLTLHTERRFSGDGYGWSLCAEDRQQWPCATVQAIHDVIGGAR